VNAGGGASRHPETRLKSSLLRAAIMASAKRTDVVCGSRVPLQSAAKGVPATPLSAKKLASPSWSVPSASRARTVPHTSLATMAQPSGTDHHRTLPSGCNAATTSMLSSPKSVSGRALGPMCLQRTATLSTLGAGGDAPR
jgi:hypothetical protein